MNTTAVAAAASSVQPFDSRPHRIKVLPKRKRVPATRRQHVRPVAAHVADCSAPNALRHRFEGPVPRRTVAVPDDRLDTRIATHQQRLPIEKAETR